MNENSEMRWSDPGNELVREALALMTANTFGPTSTSDTGLDRAHECKRIRDSAEMDSLPFGTERSEVFPPTEGITPSFPPYNYDVCILAESGIIVGSI